jgi:hypothetical protein
MQLAIKDLSTKNSMIEAFSLIHQMYKKKFLKFFLKKNLQTG